MNLHVKNNQALGVPKVASEARVSNPCSSTARLKWFVWPAVVCIGLMVSNTAVLGNTGKAKPKPNVAKTKQPKALKESTSTPGCGANTDSPQPATPVRTEQSPRWV
ncbi:MAG: hypothetical protein WBE26_10250, partial [Phycisphaerae bacterium]